MLENMIYSLEEQSVFMDEAELHNDSVPDRQEDIRPRYAKDDGGDDLDETEEDSEYIKENSLLKFDDVLTLRKASAAALSSLADYYQNSDEVFLEVALPCIDKCLVTEDPNSIYQREAGILAYGAISQGCLYGLRDHLLEVYPFILAQLDVDNVEVRVISCWTLAQNLPWLLQLDDDTQKETFRLTLGKILDMMVLHNKKVQHAASSTLSHLISYAFDLLEPYLSDVLQVLNTVLQHYQSSCLIMVWDAIATISENLRVDFARNEMFGLLMPQLAAKWNTTADNDPMLTYLLETFSVLAANLEIEFQEYAAGTFTRSLSLVEQVIEQEENNGIAADYDFCVYSLDCIAGICEGLKESVQDLVQNSSLLATLVKCCQSANISVRVSAFALLGDLISHLSFTVSSIIPDILPVLLDNYHIDSNDSTSLQACNNVSWCIGLIALKYDDGSYIRPYLENILTALDALLNIVYDKDYHNLHENLVTTVGYLAVKFPQEINLCGRSFLISWLKGLESIGSFNDRRDAFNGFLLVIKENPDILIKTEQGQYYAPEDLTKIFDLFSFAIMTWYDAETQMPQIPDEEMSKCIDDIVRWFKEQINQSGLYTWEDFSQVCDTEGLDYINRFHS